MRVKFGVRFAFFFRPIVTVTVTVLMTVLVSMTMLIFMILRGRSLDH